jgi:DNA-binding MarR family transcriptional regulator
VTRRRAAADTADVARFASAIMTFVRDFGLLQPDTTPCGKPISVTQAHALACIASRSTTNQRDLGVTLGLARATTSELVAQLIDRGWAARSTVEGDRRQRHLELTEAGRRMASDVAEARHELMRELLTELNADDRARVVESAELLATLVHRHRAGLATSAGLGGQGSP